MTEGNPELNIFWTSYAKHYKQMLIEMMVLDKYTDVTLVCDDMVHVQSHKAILGSCSKMFRKIFDSADNGSKIFLYLKGTKSNHLKSILQFLYGGEALVTPQDLSDILKLAADLGITDIIRDNLENLTNKEQQISKQKIGANIERNQNDLEEEKDGENQDNNELLENLNNGDDFEDTFGMEKNENLFVEHEECNECDEIFENKLALMNHLQSEHTNQFPDIEKTENKFSCHVCEAEFTKKMVSKSSYRIYTPW